MLGQQDTAHPPIEAHVQSTRVQEIPLFVTAPIVIPKRRFSIMSDFRFLVMFLITLLLVCLIPTFTLVFLKVRFRFPRSFLDCLRFESGLPGSEASHKIFTASALLRSTGRRARGWTWHCSGCIMWITLHYPTLTTPTTHISLFVMIPEPSFPPVVPATITKPGLPLWSIVISLAVRVIPSRIIISTSWRYWFNWVKLDHFCQWAVWWGLEADLRGWCLQTFWWNLRCFRNCWCFGRMLCCCCCCFYCGLCFLCLQQVLSCPLKGAGCCCGVVWVSRRRGLCWWCSTCFGLLLRINRDSWGLRCFPTQPQRGRHDSSFTGRCLGRCIGQCLWGGCGVKARRCRRGNRFGFSYWMPSFSAGLCLCWGWWCFQLAIIFALPCWGVGNYGSCLGKNAVHSTHVRRWDCWSFLWARHDLVLQGIRPWKME